MDDPGVENQMVTIVRSLHILPIASLALLLALAGCAQQPKVFRFQLPQGSAEVWPPPPAQARIAYIGDITGETNLEDDEHKVQSGLQGILEAVAGVGLDDEPKLKLKRPQSGFVSSDGRIFVTDVGAAAVYVFDEVKGEMEVWDRFGINQSFLQPIGIAPGPEGQILVADAEYGYIVRLSPEGEFIDHFGDEVLKRPTGLARDPERGWIFVADTRAHDIKVFNDQGELIDVWGSPGTDPGQFNSPVYLNYRPGHLYVTDTLNARIQVLSMDGSAVEVIGRRGIWVGNLVRPKGVAIDSDDNMYVVESYYDHLLIFNQQGDLLLPIGGAGGRAGNFYLPSGVWSDQRDRIFVADMLNARVSIFQYLGSIE